MSDPESAAPLDVVEATVGNTVTVQLKDEQAVHGTLEGYDQHLNVVLSTVENSPTPTPTDEQTPDAGNGMLVIRGQMVVSITQPPTTTESSKATTTDDRARHEETTANESDTTEAPTPPDGESKSKPPQSDASTELAQLKHQLEAHDLTVSWADDGETLIITKLGQEYRVQPGDVVDGDGPHREQITDLIC